MKVSWTCCLSIFFLLIAIAITSFLNIFVFESTSWKANFTIAEKYHVSLARRSDLNGMMEIWAESPEGFAAALGYSHAKDRLVSMIMARSLSQGKLTEHFQHNAQLEKLDITSRVMGNNYMANQNFEQFHSSEYAPYYAFIEAYIAGINHYINHDMMFRPLELILVGHYPEQFDTKDIFALMGLICFDVGMGQSQFRLEKFIASAIKDGVQLDILKSMFAPSLDKMTQETVSLIKSLSFPGYSTDPNVKFMQNIFPPMQASNNWVVNGKWSKSGYPIMSSDPHLPLNRLPSFWYETIAHLKVGKQSIDVYGISVPALPAIIMGRNNHVSWSLTYGVTDQIDLYAIEVKDMHYLVDNKWLPLRKRTEVIYRKGIEPLDIVIYETDHGFIDRDHTDFTDLKNGKYLLVQWVIPYDEPGVGDAISSAIFSRNTLSSTTATAFAKEVPNIIISCNYLIADDGGNIVYQQGGRAPIRPENVTGLYVLDYSKSENHWKGIATGKDLLHIENPPSGILVTANDERQKKGGSVIQNVDMGPNRKNRITYLLNEFAKDKGHVTVEDMKIIQSDVYSADAERFIQLLKPVIKEIPSLGSELLMNWDFKFDKDCNACYIFELIHKSFFHEYLSSVFGRDLWTWLEDYDLNFVMALMHYPENYILDNLKIQKEKGRIKKIFEPILTQKDFSTFKSVRKTEMKNLFFQGKLPKWLGFDYPFELYGSHDTVRQGNLFHGKEIEWSFGQSWRFVTDMSSSSVYSVLPGGVSGQRFSGLYTSDMELYLSNRYKYFNVTK